VGNEVDVVIGASWTDGVEGEAIHLMGGLQVKGWFFGAGFSWGEMDR